MDLCVADGGCAAQMLPTFSSAGIETLLHRIPKLSKRFLYLNDDVYVGCDIYPDDLYTHGGGVTVFTAWNLPECAADCPWSYIGKFRAEECVFNLIYRISLRFYR